MTTTITPEILARAAALGAAGAALSVTQNPTLVRRLGLGTAGVVGGLVAWAAGTGRLPGERPADPAQGEGGPAAPLPPVAAIGLGAATFGGLALVSELGTRAQGRLERWADRTTGRPRLTVAVVTAAASVAIDLLEKRLEAVS